MKAFTGTREMTYSAKRDDLLKPGKEQHCLLPDSRPLNIYQLCAEFSRLAYTNDNIVTRGGLTNIGFSEIKWLSVSNNQALIAWNSEEKLGIISFRGTEPDQVGDIAADLGISLIPHPDPTKGKIHEGFYQAFYCLQHEIETWMSEIEQNNSKIDKWLITGHSLGAAMATIAASVLHFSKGSKHLINFGSPRVGNVDFIQAINSVEHRRYVNCCDVICRIPPTINGMGNYGHLPNEYYIGQKGVITHNPAPTQIAQDQQQARLDYFTDYAWRKDCLMVRDMADHSPINYFNALL